MRFQRAFGATGLAMVVLAIAAPAQAVPKFTCHTDFCNEVALGAFSYAWIAGAPMLAVLFGLGAYDGRRPGARGERRPTARYVVAAAAFGLALSIAIGMAARDVAWPWWSNLVAPVVAAPLAYLMGRWRLIG